MNAVIYARYSSDKQSEQSIEGQLRYCHEYAKRQGYTVVNEYIDRALSGKKDSRPEFQRMIADSSKKQFNFIIVWKLDRFSRSRYDSAIYKVKLKKNGVRVVSATESIGEGNESVIMEAMLEAMAEVYSNQIGENASRGMKESALKGYCTGGNIPLGYFVGEDKFLHTDDKTAPAVRYIFEQYAAGINKQQIANGLNEKGFTTKEGKRWNASNTTHILQNKMYMGDYNYKGEIERSCPAIIDPVTFAAVQERIAVNKKAYGRTKKETFDFILYGKIFCGYCGSLMAGDSGTSRGGEKHFYYTCSRRKNHKRTGEQNCKKKSEKAGYIEWYLVEQTVNYVLTPARIEYIAENVVAQYETEFGDATIAELEKRLAEIDRDLNSLLKKLLSTDVQVIINKINERAAELELQKQDGEIDLAKLRIANKVRMTKDEVVKWLKAFCKGDPLDPEFRQRIIDTFINSVYLYDDKIVIYYNVEGGEQVSYIENIDKLDEISESDSVRAEHYKGSQIPHNPNISDLFS